MKRRGWASAATWSHREARHKEFTRLAPQDDREASHAMGTIGPDLHERESQLCVLADDGSVTERRIDTTRERLAATLGGRPPARVLLEASTESEWVARHLETLGHAVVVADPTYAPMYATRSRRVKTDTRDARTLAEACRLGAYRRAHRLSDAQRHVRAELAVRDALVRTRSGPPPRRAPGDELPRARAERAELGRAAAPRAHHHGG